MSTFRSAAIQILYEECRAMSPKELSLLAIQRGLITTEGETPAATMSARISTDIQKNGEHSPFIRSAKGLYELNPRLNIESIKAKEERIEELVEEEVEERIWSSYTGKAGEFAVASELLFRGWNASVMTVDEGIDIVAEKNGALKYIQVKTANVIEESVNGVLMGDYVFDLRVSSFQRYTSNDVYYVFVLRNFNDYGDRDIEEYRIYIILPYVKLAEFIDSQIIKTVGNGSRYRINIKLREKGFFFGNSKNDVMEFVNHWELITK